MTITISPSIATYLFSASNTAASNAGTRGNISVGQAIYITGSNDILTNAGTLIAGITVVGTAEPVGAVVVKGGTGDSVTNQFGGYIHGNETSVPGINFYTTSGTVSNSGLIVSGEGPSGSSANGVDMRHGGAVTNLSTGTIIGGGVYVGGLTGTVVNSGKILGDSIYGGVALLKGGMITNLAGTIAANGGGYGVSILGGAGTVSNAGTITGDSSAGFAVILTAGFTNRVIVDPGAVFVGYVDGGAALHSTLELASGASTGTVSGFASQYVNFGTVTFDPSSSWLVKGNTGITSAVFDNIAAGDTIDMTGFVAVTGTTVSGNTGFILTNVGGAHETLSFGSSIASFAFTTGVFGTDVTGVCFCAGTWIATPAGEAPVEQLRAGDIVLTAHNGPRTITWIGEGKVLATRGRRSVTTPVIIRSGALGPGVPRRDLHVTKGHSLYLDEVLIPVEFLVNHRTILWDDHAQEVHVFHVELETHDVLVADGAPAESYRDDGNRWLFQNGNPRWDQKVSEPYAPILTGGAVVDAVWRRLLERAGGRALPPMTDDADLHLIVDGVCVEASRRLGDDIVFQLPRRPETVRLASRAMVPDELGLARDPRCLGVAVRRITIRQGNGEVTIRAHDRRLTDGFHDYEAAGDLRWTNGDAALPATAFTPGNGLVEVIVHLGAATRYPVFAERAANTNTSLTAGAA